MKNNDNKTKTSYVSSKQYIVLKFQDIPQVAAKGQTCHNLERYILFGISIVVNDDIWEKRKLEAIDTMQEMIPDPIYFVDNGLIGRKLGFKNGSINGRLEDSCISTKL